MERARKVRVSPFKKRTLRRRLLQYCKRRNHFKTNRFYKICVNKEKFIVFEGANRELDLFNISMYEDAHLNYILNYRSEISVSESHIKLKFHWNDKPLSCMLCRYDRF